MLKIGIFLSKYQKHITPPGNTRVYNPESEMFSWVASLGIVPSLRTVRPDSHLPNSDCLAASRLIFFCIYLVFFMRIQTGKNVSTFIPLSSLSLVQVSCYIVNLKPKSTLLSCVNFVRDSSWAESFGLIKVLSQNALTLTFAFIESQVPNEQMFTFLLKI